MKARDTHKPARTRPGAMPRRAAWPLALGVATLALATTAVHAGPARNQLTGISASAINASAVSCDIVVQIDHEAIRGHRSKWLTIQEKVNFGPWSVVNTIAPAPRGTGTLSVTMHGRNAGSFYEYRSTLFEQKGKSPTTQLDQTAATDALMCG